MKIVKHLLDLGLCGGIILKYILKVFIQTSSGAVVTRWVPVGTRTYFPGADWLGHETDHLLPANAEDTPAPCNIPSWRGQGQLYVFLGFLKE